MNELQVLKERIQMLQEEMDAYEREYQYHTEKAKTAQKKSNELYEEQKELEDQRKSLEITAMTQDDIDIVLSQLKQLQVLLTSDIVSNINLHICDVSISIENECCMRKEEMDKYLRELHIEIRRTELTEKGLDLSIYVKTNRPIVKEMIKNYMNIESDDSSYYWSKEEYPTTKFMKDVFISKV
jgi:hypothetical protein